MLTKMKEKFPAIVNVILFGVIIFMGASMYEDNREMNLESKHNMTGGHYNCLENPIDPLFAEALSNAHVMAEYRQIQQLYYDIWIAQYDTIMKKIRIKCKYEEDIANYTLFTDEMEKGFERLQPMILNEMLDNYHVPESPEKNSWGNGTQETLLLYRGMMYRNACMFLIPFLEKSEYTFPVNKVKDSLSQMTGINKLETESMLEFKF